LTIIRFDECISWRVVDALRALNIAADIELESPRHRDQLGMGDVPWIEDFAARGGRVVVSGDARMRNVALERAALEVAGLIAIFPSSKKYFDGLGRFGQIAYLVRWFPAIEQLARNAPRGTHYRLPPSFSGEADQIEELRSLADIEAEKEEKKVAREQGGQEA